MRQMLLFTAIAIALAAQPGCVVNGKKIDWFGFAIDVLTEDDCDCDCCCEKCKH